MIVCKDINKTIEGRHIIKNCSFHISRGECVGLIGKNGAGKTTLLNLLTGLYLPDSGFLRVSFTENILAVPSALREVVYVSSTKSQLWTDLQIKASLENCIRMYRGSLCRLEELIDLFEISALLGQYPASLSLGEKMRCEMVYALLAEPRLLFMDEIMVGLDVSVKARIMEYFAGLKEEKRITIIYTSHDLMEVETLCERILLLDEGRLIFDGATERILSQYAPLYELHLVPEDAMLPDFEDLPIDKYTIQNDRIKIWFDKKKIQTAELIQFVTRRCRIRDLKLVEPSLEETIKRIYKA